MMEAAQCRAARALLDWTQSDLSGRSGLSVVSIRAFEKGGEMRDSNRKLLRLVFERSGVEFIPENGGGAGVRLRAKAEERALPPRKLADVLASFAAHRLPKAATQVGVGNLRFVMAGSQATLMEGDRTVGMISVRAHEVVFSPELPTGRLGEGSDITEDDLWNWVIAAWRQSR